MTSSTMADTKAQVIQTYDGHPTYSCLKCAAVIVGLSPPLTRSTAHVSMTLDRHYKMNL